MGKTVMVIDDADSVRQSVGFSLQEAGFDVLEASDGQDALNKLGGKEVHLFICDVNMPNMDGIAFLKKIKTDAAYASYKFTPLIMLTTEAGQDKMAEGKGAGAKAWIVKPFKPEQLLDAVKKLVG
jgi:two-component system, chemotaxis family, chemotaxis protein CheY